MSTFDASQPRTNFTLKPKKKKWPWVTAGVVVVVGAGLFAGLAQANEGGAAGFGPTLKIHFEPAMAGEESIIDFVDEEIAPDYGIDLEAVGLQDGTQADRAVAEGEYAATIYQHNGWLQQVIAANGFKLTPVTEVFQWGFGLYSEQHPSVEALPEGALIMVPDDGANQAQALWLLEREGLIGLDKEVDPQAATIRDITENSHNFEFQEIALLSMPRILGSVDAAIGYVSQFDAGKIDRDKGILFPDAPKVFASQLVIGTEYLDDPQIQKLIKAFSDPRLEEYLKTTEDPLVQGVLTPVSAD